VDEIMQRIAVLEQQVRLLSRQAGVPCPKFASDFGDFGGVPWEVVELAHSGKKIQAIQRLRELTGLGLGEAKAVVDAL
jgi:ribosomal protein L7/L12